MSGFFARSARAARHIPDDARYFEGLDTHSTYGNASRGHTEDVRRTHLLGVERRLGIAMTELYDRTRLDRMTETEKIYRRGVEGSLEFNAFAGVSSLWTEFIAEYHHSDRESGIILNELYYALVVLYVYVTDVRREAVAVQRDDLFEYSPLVYECMQLCRHEMRIQQIHRTYQIHGINPEQQPTLEDYEAVFGHPRIREERGWGVVLSK